MVKGLSRELFLAQKIQVPQDFQTNAEMIAAYWNTHLGIDSIVPSDVPTMMALLKIARVGQRPESAENFRDAAGYIALAGELNEV